MIRGTLIVFEGPEGVGKSTLALMLNDWFQRNFVINPGSSSRFLAEPGSPDLGLCRDIREMMFKREYSRDNDSLIQGLLFFIAHYRNAQYAKQLVNQGTHAVCDRWNPSSKQAYEVILEKPTPNWIMEAFHVYEGHLIKPDIVFLLDYDPQVGMERAKARTDKVVRQGDKMWNAEDMNVKLRRAYRDIYLERGNWYLVQPRPDENAQQVFDRYILPVVVPFMENNLPTDEGEFETYFVEYTCGCSIVRRKGWSAPAVCPIERHQGIAIEPGVYTT